MDALSLTTSNPFHIHSLSHLIKQQNRTSHTHFTVSCTATKTKFNVAEQGNLYKVLSLNPGTAITNDEIKRAYRSMALQFHPDVCHDPSMKEESTRIFVQLNAAYETLSNPMLRAQYDFELGLGRKIRVCGDDDERWRSNCWEEQVVELKKRSHRRMGQKGNRMRATHMKQRN